MTILLESFLTSGRHCPQSSEHLAGRRPQDQVAQSSPGDGNVLIRSEDVNLLICQDYPGLGNILHSVLDSSSLASQSTNSSR